jgi:CelD/BcsL family acetyltransferase involved in cellulose biosynthesis
MRTEAHDGPLERLVDDWQELFDADDRATPFAAPGWIMPWWRDYGRSARPLTVKVLEGRRLVGLAPLAVRRQGPFRVLFGAGAGVGNYWDVLSAKPEREEVSRRVAAHVRARSARWDAFLLDRCEAGSPLPAALEDEGLPIQRRPPTAFVLLPLPATFDAYVKTLSSKMRHEVRRSARQLDAGEFATREAREPAEIADAVAHWHRLRVRWWQERGRAMHADHARPGFGRFAAEVMQELVPRRLGRVVELWHADARVGVWLYLVDDGTLYSWLSGFDTALVHRSPGPGTVAKVAAIRYCIETGRRLDLMIGQESYKYRLGGVDHWLPYLVVGNRRASSHVVLGAVRWRDRRRRARAATAAAA